MYKWQKEKIKITEDSKVLIGLGDSFTQGEGACDISLWEKYNWDLNLISDKINRQEINESNLKNSWVNKICENHLPDFIPINMGMTGRGNRGAVKELYLHPDLNIEIAKEKIVVFMLTGIERFDFVHKHFFDHLHFYTMWPNKNTPMEESKLWDSYRDYVWSDRFAIIEMLLSIAELKNWCIVHNASLIITSAFRPEYNRKYFFEKIQEDNGNFMDEKISYINYLVDIIDWNNYLRPEGFNCMTDYLLHLEGREDLILGESAAKYYEFGSSFENLSPLGYITKCAHPSYKGHEAIADVIYKHIIKLKK
jgi:hypothetical protein